MSRSLATYEARLEELATDLPGLVHPVMGRIAELVRDEVDINLSGRVLQRISGDLAESVEVEALSGPTGAGISAIAGGPTVRYAAAHERGQVIKAAGEGYLHFRGRYGWARVREVTIPARPFLRPAIEHAAEAELPERLHERFIELLQGG